MDPVVPDSVIKFKASKVLRSGTEQVPFYSFHNLGAKINEL